MVLGVSNPFRSSKWRHRSTTVEMKDEESCDISPQHTNTGIAPPSPPDSSTNNTTTTTNSTTIKKKKLLPAPPFNSDSLLNGIGDYIFESPLGGGKFSKVMLSHHYLTGEKVAIKVYTIFISKKKMRYFSFND